jgi:hypothetical protein
MLDVKELERIITESQSKTIEVDGRKFLFGKCTEIMPLEYHHSTLTFEELNSIVTMIKKDAGSERKLYVHIENTYTVSVFTAEDEKLKRDYLYKAVFKGKQFSYGTWLDYENFIISLRAKFMEDDERNKLITLIASVKNVDDNEVLDNGITQTTKTKQGAGLVHEGEVKAIYSLTPYRTFNEAIQAPAEYLFRISKRGGKELVFGIFEADGGRWELMQKANIAVYFLDNLTDELKSGKVILVS